MKPRSIKNLTKLDLERLDTKRLLAYLKKLNHCEESFEKSDWCSEDIAGIKGIVFKESSEWTEMHSLVKQVLAKRENVER